MDEEDVRALGPAFDGLRNQLRAIDLELTRLDDLYRRLRGLAIQALPANYSEDEDTLALAVACGLPADGRLATGRDPGSDAQMTDTGRAALLWVLWHHQGEDSPIGQALRFALGMGAHERLTDSQVAEARTWALRGLTPGECREKPVVPADVVFEARRFASLPQTLRSCMWMIVEERWRQDTKWGGPEHDDGHTTANFAQLVQDYAGWARVMAGMGSDEKAQRRMVQVAALAVADVERMLRAADSRTQPAGSFDARGGDHAQR